MDLIDASRNGNVGRVKELLLVESGGADVNLQNEYGDTALVQASSYDRLEIVKELLLVEGIDVNLQDEEGNTALILASSNDLLEIVKELLLVEGIDVNLQDDGGETALIRASYWGYLEIVELLLSVESVDVNLQNKNGDTALMVASYRGCLEIVKELVKKGAWINIDTILAADDGGKYALVGMLAGWSDDERMLSKLTLHQRCWLNILIRKIDYTGTILIRHILDMLWLESSYEFCDSEDTGIIWTQGYVIRMREKL